MSSPNLTEYLCFHAAIHHQFMYVGPRALLDVARLIVNPPRPIDWADLVDRAREREWTRGVWLMLDLVRKHLGVPAPQVVLQALRPRDANHATIHDVAMSALFIDLQFQGKLPPNLAVLMNDTSLRGRASILLKRIFISREALAAYFQIPVNMPGLQWFYLKRWGLMIRQYLPNIISLVIGNHARRTEMARMQTISRWING